MNIRILMGAAMLALLCAAADLPSQAAEKEVTFKTEDGWTLSGMLSAPERTGVKFPAVIFLHSFEHDQSTYGQYLYPGLAQIIGSREVATLRFDFRGRGKSLGSKELSSFSAEELSKLYLDVRAAISFLESQPDVDSSRMGIVAEGASADAAVRGWGGDSRIKAMVLISGRLSQAAKEQIAANPEIPIFLVVSKEDRVSFRDMADAYKLTTSEGSRINVYENIGIGTTMFSVWRSQHPKEKPIEEILAEWMIEQLNLAGRKWEVSFQTEDGWTLYGTLRTPGGAAKSSGLPGVIMIHSSFTDRQIFDHLAELAVRQGLMALNIDTRGRGKSTNKGEFLLLPVDERERGHLDAKAAVNFLASQHGVSRVGLLGTDRGAKYALDAAIGDPRVGALVLMTTVVSPKDIEQIAALEIPVFYIGSKDIDIAAKSMAAAYAVTRNRGSRILIYSGGALGYDIFELDENLEPTLAHWFKEQLSR